MSVYAFIVFVLINLIVRGEEREDRRDGKEERGGVGEMERNREKGEGREERVKKEREGDREKKWGGEIRRSEGEREEERKR